MPLLFSRHPFPGATFGLWQIAEAESFFREDLPLSEAEEQEYGLLKGIRRHEWLAARWLLHQFTGQAVRLPLAKDAFSKPFFPHNEQLGCSLSHSHGVVGALLVRGVREEREVREVKEVRDGGRSVVSAGCDIQVVVDKMSQLAPKFLHETEWAFVWEHPSVIHPDLFHIFWTAKESMYKAYGLKALDFRAHMRLHPFEWNGESGRCEAWIQKADFHQKFRIQFEKMELPDRRMIVWAVAELVMNNE